MAKGLRSSTLQRNKSKLRATVYGPAIDSRTERLSAKLQALVSNPKPRDSDLADMQIDNAAKIENSEEPKPKDPGPTDDMDLDDDPANSKPEAAESEKAHSNRIKKKTRNKKRPSIVFQKHSKKSSKGSKKK